MSVLAYIYRSAPQTILHLLSARSLRLHLSRQFFGTTLGQVQWVKSLCSAVDSSSGWVIAHHFWYLYVYLSLGSTVNVLKSSLKLLHQFDGGIVSAFLDLQGQEIASFASISSQVHFGEEPEILTTAFQRQEIPGYVFRPTCLKDALVAFLEGRGIPDAEAGAEIGVNQLAEDLHEDLDNYGSRVRLFYLAITASRSRVLSSVSVSVMFMAQL